MDRVVKTLCVVSLIWIAGWSDDGCESPGEPDLPDIGYPSCPDPRDGSTIISIEPVLSWYMDGEMDDDDYTYDVYFGTAEDLKDPPLVAENLDSTEYDIGTLNYETTYSWRIVATENYSYRVSEGPLWSFTTYNGVIINEGFEGEFPPPGWSAESAWDLSNKSHTGESSARGIMTDRLSNAELLSPVFNIYQDVSGSIDLSFYYKCEFPGFIPKLGLSINTYGSDIDLFSGWVDNEDWALAEYTVSRSNLRLFFRVVFRTYHYSASGRASVLIDDVLVKDSALE